MMDDFNYRELLVRTLIALAAGAMAVVVCYLWVDRPVALFVDRHQFNKFQIFLWLTYPPATLQTWSPLVLAALMVRRAWGPFARWQKVLLVACVSLIVADQFRTTLGNAFGRYWPDTWFDDNPSLIRNGVYGFEPFARGDEGGSFPSGHATRILAFAAVWWIAMPGSRALCVIFCPLLLASLVAMDYHFVGDVIAGGVLGGVVGAYAAHLSDGWLSNRPSVDR